MTECKHDNGGGRPSAASIASRPRTRVSPWARNSALWERTQEKVATVGSAHAYGPEKDFAVKIEWEPHGSTPANVSIYLLVFRGDLNRGWENDDAKIVENNIDCWQYVVLGDRFMQIKVTPDWAPKVAPKVAK